MHIVSADSAEGFRFLPAGFRSRKDLSQFNPARIAGLVHCNCGNQVQPKQRQIAEVVHRKVFALQMSMDEAKTPEPSGSSPQPSDVRDHEAGNIAEDHMVDFTFPRQQDSDLTPKFPGQKRQVARQFSGNHLLRRNPAAEGALQTLSLGRFQTENIAVNLLNIRPR